MIRLRHLSFFLLLQVVLGTALGSFAAVVPATKPKTFDLGNGKSVFSQALSSSKGLVDIEFVGDQQIAATAIDHYVWPTYDSDPADIHFNIYFFNAVTGVETPQEALQFTVNQASPALRGLPSGGFLVSLGKEVLSYNAQHKLIARAPAADICGVGKEWPSEAPLNTFLYVASDEVAVLNVVKDRPEADLHDRSRKQESYYCWFSTHDLHAIDHFQATTYSPSSVAQNDKIHLLFPGLTQEISPTGVTAVPIPSQCPNKQLVEMRVLYLLHFEDASILPCSKQTLALKTGEKVELLKIRSSELYPYIVADAWRSPVILLHCGKTEVKLFGGFKSSDELELFNYRSGKSLSLLKSKEDIPGPIYISGSIKYSLSPSGKRVAISRGPLVRVYEIPDQFLSTSDYRSKDDKH